MIAITNDRGLNLELFSNQALVTEQAAAWLVDDELPAEYSYPIDAPLTENNQRFVAHGYRPDSATPRLVMPVTVTLGGVLYRRALMTFKLQEGKLNISLKIDSAEAYDKLRKISLLEALAKPVRIGDGVIGSTNGIAKTLSLTERLAQIAAAPIGTHPAAFFPIRNELFFEENWQTKVPGALEQTQSYVNCYTLTGSPGRGNFVADYNFGTGIIRGYPICPQLHLWWVLEQIMGLAGFRIESDWMARESVQRLCILNLTALPPVGPTLDDVFGGHTFIPGQCLPDMAVSDFLKAIKQRFGLCFTFNANTRVCSISQFVGAVAKGAAVNLTAYQNGPYSADQPTGTGFAVSDYIDSSDELYRDTKGQTIEPDPLLVGKGGTPIALKVGSCQSIYTDSAVSTGKWQVPTVRQAGNVQDAAYSASDRYVDEKGLRRNNIGLRLLSYEGMVTDSTGAYYPFASTESCDLAGRNGIWRNGLRQYFYFRDQSQPISQKLLLPAYLLAGLPLHRSVGLSLADQILRSYLITKLRAESPGPQGLLTVLLDGQSIPAGIDQPADVDEPYVWLELIQETQTGILGDRPDGVSFNTYDLSKLTVKVWADKAKSRAAVVGRLPIRVRRLKTWPRTDIQRDNGQIRTVFYQETISTYYISGQQTLIEDAIKTALLLVATGDVYDWYSLKLQLDPGEGYGIL